LGGLRGSVKAAGRLRLETGVCALRVAQKVLD
jgi:hypothetical protein